MRKLSSRFAGLCVGLLVSVCGGANAVAAEPAYGICEAQVRADVKARFGKEIRYIH